MPVDNSYNPDVLTCIANLSNDEVFTPPSLANNILDLLPSSLWNDKDTRFLDPSTKSGIFLREIVRRLNKGLENEIPNQQKRINHILTNQVFGFAITELTALLSRRSLYCSKSASSKYSISDKFSNEEGNILYEPIQHTWVNGKCIFCGGSESEYKRSSALETHAYKFIHLSDRELKNMKFDVIVSNPPYQLSTGGNNAQAKPIYNIFVEQAIKLNPRFIAMITPSRYFSGGMGLDGFRETMLSSKKIKVMVDFTNAKDCFPGISLSGGVNYFLWSRDHNGSCEFTSIHDGKTNTEIRDLNEFPILIRHNEAINIIKKVRKINNKSLTEIVNSINVFGFPSSERGIPVETKNSLKIIHSQGFGYVDRNLVTQGVEIIDKFKVLISRTISEHAGEHNKEGKFKLIAKTAVLKPKEICTHSYLIIGAFSDSKIAKNLQNYLHTKFVRFLILQAVAGIDLSKDKFMFVPLLDFKNSYCDNDLYELFKLTKSEISYIDNMMTEMGKGNEE